MKLKGGVLLSLSLSLRKPLVFVVVALLILGTFLSTFGFIPPPEKAYATTPWYDYDWQYRKAITIDNTAGSALTDYQVQVALNNTNFDFSKAQTDGSDIRFTDSDATTLISFWTESYDSVAETAVLWSKIPSISAGSTKTIYMYYGNLTASSASNGDNTFLFFDDAESGVATDKWETVLGSPTFAYANAYTNSSSYAGNWYQDLTTGYHGPMTTYTDKHRPMAIYSALQDKTFFVFGSEDDHAEIGYYDHTTHTFSAPVEVGSITEDAHENPSILIDEDGYIYVFYGSHGSTMYTKRSTNPYDISSWDTKATIAGHTYPQAWQLKSGEIIHFYRDSGSDEAYRISTDGAATWGDATKFIDFGGTTWIYAMTIADNGSYPRAIHLTWTVREGAGLPRRNVYYAKSLDGGTTWLKSDGTQYALPIVPATAELIYDSGADEVQSSDIQLDSEGNPYAIYTTGSGTSWDWKLIKRNTTTGVWESHSIGAAADHQFDTGALVIINDNDFRAYLPSVPTQVNEDGGDIEEWKSTDKGNTWSKTADITSGSAFSHNFIRSVYNSNPDFRIFWGYGDSSPNAWSNVDLYFYGEDQVSATRINNVIEVSNHVLHIAGPTGEKAIKAKNLNLSDFILEVDIRPSGSSFGNSTLNVRVNASGYNYDVRANSTSSRIFRYNGSYTQLGTTQPEKDTTDFHKWTVKIHDVSGTPNINFLWDDSTILDTSDNTNMLSGGSVGARVSNSTITLDNIRVRQYTSTEPSTTVGAEVPLTAPAVTVQPADSVTANSAVLQGTITDVGTTNATTRGFKYYQSNDCTGAENDNSENGSFGAEAYSLGLLTLLSNTPYSYKAYATSPAGTGTSGTCESFTTLPNEPTVTVQAASNIAQTTATLNGTITNVDGVNATERGFNLYAGLICAGGVTQNPKDTGGSYGAAAFSKGVVGLTANSNYSYKSYAINTGGTGTSGTCESFTTLSSGSGSGDDDDEEETTPTETPVTTEIPAPEEIVEEITNTLYNSYTSQPSASFSLPDNNISGNQVTFDASGSTSNKGIVSYIWDFGDGNKASGIKVSHQYKAPGRYTVTLTITDRVGNKNTTTKTVDIKPIVPTITNIKAKGTNLWIEGKADPNTTIYFTIHSNPFEGQGLANKDGFWTYNLENASEVIGEGEHTVVALAAVKLSDNTELKGAESKTYDFKMSVDNGKLKVEMQKTRVWQYISLGLVLLIVIGFLLKRFRKGKLINR